MDNRTFERRLGGLVEDITSRFMDAYQCYDWDISAVELACYTIEQVKSQMLAIAHELDNPDDE